MKKSEIISEFIKLVENTQKEYQVSVDYVTLASAILHETINHGETTADEIKEECCKVYDTIRSSAILGLEISTAQVNNIKISFSVFAYSVKYSGIEDIKTAADDLISLLAP